VLDSICVVIKFNENYEANQAVWQWMGGCYEHGEMAKYIPLKP
jgi:hypothetical protein